jgi:hypothetical protein
LLLARHDRPARAHHTPPSRRHQAADAFQESSMSGLTALLLSPLTFVLGLMSRYPWQSIAACGVAAAVLLLLRNAGWASGFVMVGSIILVWLDETRSARPINEGVAAGD